MISFINKYFQKDLKTPTQLENFCVPQSGSFRHQLDINTVLVEDEWSIRSYWKEFFQARNLKIDIYSSEEDFLKALPLIQGPVQFYFDQDFGFKNRGVGIRLARHVRDLPNRVQTSLITGYHPNDFKSEFLESIIDFVLPKFPETLFGIDFPDEQMILKVWAQDQQT